MSNQTKIIVIRQKNLLIFFFMLVAMIIFIACFLAAKNTSTPTDDTPAMEYRAGIYSSTIELNGNPVEIRVTMDNGLIHDIATTNVSDSIETVFPLFNSCFEEIVTQVIANNSTENVTYPEENQYTGMVLLDAINQAICKSYIIGH